MGESQQSEESRDKEEATEATSGGNSERLATGSTVISHNNISITHKEKRRKVGKDSVICRCSICHFF